MTPEEIYWLLEEFNRYSGVPGILYFSIFVRKWRADSAIFFYILLLSFVFDFSIHLYTKFVFPNSYIGGNLWVILNFGLMSWFFIRILPSYKQQIVYLYITFLLSTVISFGLWYSLFDSNTIIRTFSSVAFLILSILGFKELMTRPKGDLLKMPVFYALAIFFLYYSTNFLRGLFQQYLVVDLHVSAEQMLLIAMISLVINALKNYVIFYIIVLLEKGVYDPMLNSLKN